MAFVLGVVGGGQLARMMIPAAVELGIEVRVLAAAEGESASLAVTAIGDYRDHETLAAFASGVDVVTFDHEHVPQDALAHLEQAGAVVRPAPHALRFAQDKLAMRAKLAELGAPVPEWAAVSTPAELQRFLDDHGGRVVVKTPRGGYDGKGVRVVTSVDQVADWLDGDPLLAEEAVAFSRELAQLVARRPSGELRAWPVVETVQREGVCAEVIAPAPRVGERVSRAAAELATMIATGLDVVGVLAVELFEATDGRLLVNELAMRPHNSGHWTIEGSVTSQFEQHVRACLDLPLGATDQRAPWSVMVNILGGPTGASLPERYRLAMADQPSVGFHSYGKESRPGRKVGHVTAIGDELDEVAYRARAAAAFFDA